MDLFDDWPAILVVIVVAVIVASVVVAVYFAIRLFRTYRLIRSQGMPTSGKVVFWAALAYLLLPLDLLPDPIALDDIGALVGAITYITHLAREHGLVDDGEASGIEVGSLEDQ